MPKTWFITGASTGLGRALADAATARGDVVFATAREDAAVADYALHDQLDVTDPAAVPRVLARAAAELGRLDVVVNNAGHGLVGVTEEVTDDELRALLETNLLGAWRVTRAALPYLRRQGAGHILQMSSVGGVVGNPGHAAYAASKFALEGMAEALAGEVAGFGVRVTVIEPGPFRTDFAGRSMHRTTPLDGYAGTPGAALREGFVRQDGTQPGDPAAAAAAMLQVVDSPRPPLRLPLGSAALDRIRDKLRSQLAEIDAWEQVALTAPLD